MIAGKIRLKQVSFVSEAQIQSECMSIRIIFSACHQMLALKGKHYDCKETVTR